MVKNEFHTLQNATEGFYKEKGSKFLAYAYHVNDEGEVKTYVDHLKKQYYDARHHCYAYILGLKEQRYRANDDGEPGHSAGDPILGQIRSRALTNCLVVVVRYFGGTKLGVGGLIHAYKTAAEDALSKVTMRTIYSQTRVAVSFEYDQTSEVERALSEFDITYTNKSYTSSCVFEFLIKDEEVTMLQEKLELIRAVGFSLP